MDIIWSSDGSKLSFGTGLGVFGTVSKQKISFSLGQYLTVYQTEIFAFFRCAEDSFQKDYYAIKNNIYTDD